MTSWVGTGFMSNTEAKVVLAVVLEHVMAEAAAAATPVGVVVKIPKVKVAEAALLIQVQILII